ncbi:MAG: 5'/3'-nucleotidase SurE [Thermodesulfobacteriota bacterium]
MLDHKPLILVTNDDGVHAPGIAALFAAMQTIGQAVMIAPEQDASAASHSLTMRRPLRVRQLGPDIYAIDGTPTDCVTIGVKKVLAKRPDLVVSGINPGPNLGDDINYSGTVAAAKEGTLLGVPSFAVSLVAQNGGGDFANAARFAGQLAASILTRGLPRDTFFNVNVPDLPAAGAGDARFTRQGRRIYDDAIKETFDPWGTRHYWIGGGIPYWDEGMDTDAQAVLAGAISVTPLHIDLTNHEALSRLRAEWPLAS